MPGFYKKQQCCASGWHLCQKSSFHRKMLDPTIANHLVAARNFIQWQQISNSHNRTKVNPKLGIAYQNVALLGKNFQWKYGFVHGDCSDARPLSVHGLSLAGTLYQATVLNTTQTPQQGNVSGQRG